VGFETVNAFRHPPVPECFMKLGCSFLQLHSGFQGIRPSSASADETVYLSFDVYSPWLHCAPSVGLPITQSKPPPVLQKPEDCNFSIPAVF